MSERPHGTVLETERLWLRSWRDQDLDLFRPITTDPAMMRFIREGQLWTDAEIRFFIDREQKHFDTHGFSLWAMIHKGSGELIGQCGLKHLAQTGMIEVGWWVAAKHWGEGLATEAGRAAIDAGFSRFGIDRLVAISHPDNKASLRIMEKLGMQYVRDMPRSELGMDSAEPVVLYEIFPPEELPGG